LIRARNLSREIAPFSAARDRILGIRLTWLYHTYPSLACGVEEPEFTPKEDELGWVEGTNMDWYGENLQANKNLFSRDSSREQFLYTMAQDMWMLPPADRG
jgi:hypothetical protein